MAYGFRMQDIAGRGSWADPGYGRVAGRSVNSQSFGRLPQINFGGGGQQIIGRPLPAPSNLDRAVGAASSIGLPLPGLGGMDLNQMWNLWNASVPGMGPTEPARDPTDPSQWGGYQRQYQEYMQRQRQLNPQPYRPLAQGGGVGPPSNVGTGIVSGPVFGPAAGQAAIGAAQADVPGADDNSLMSLLGRAYRDQIGTQAQGAMGQLNAQHLLASQQAAANAAGQGMGFGAGLYDMNRQLQTGQQNALMNWLAAISSGIG